ncbi:MAG: hypothetical protein ACE10J_08840, partial [Thermodesulfobacteriota bacterium]
MNHSKQGTKTLFINVQLKVVCSFFVMAVCCLIMAASPASASPQEYGEFSAEDFKESKPPPAGLKVYSPFVGRDYPDQVLFGDA